MCVITIFSLYNMEENVTLIRLLVKCKLMTKFIVQLKVEVYIYY